MSTTLKLLFCLTIAMAAVSLGGTVFTTYHGAVDDPDAVLNTAHMLPVIGAALGSAITLSTIMLVLNLPLQLGE